MNTNTKNTEAGMFKGMTPDEIAAAKRLAALNHCTPGEMVKRVRSSIRRTASTKAVRVRDIGVAPASDTEVQEAAQRLADWDGCTPDEIKARARAAMRRVSCRRSKLPPYDPLKGRTPGEIAADLMQVARARGITVEAAQAVIESEVERGHARAMNHTTNTILAGDRRKVSAFVGQVLHHLPAGDYTDILPGNVGTILKLAADGKSRAEITSTLLRKGVQV